MIPRYLDDLNLPQTFSAYTHIVDPYIHESIANEHVVDSNANKISGFVSGRFGQSEDLAGKFFAVENPSGQPYALLQIDNGIIKSSATKKCDCAITNASVLCLIEFKANATSSNPTTVENNYKKAIEQLTTTIGIFGSPLSLRTVEAYVCFRQGYPRRRSSQMHYQVAFAKANNGIPLLFERKKVL